MIKKIFVLLLAVVLLSLNGCTFKSKTYREFNGLSFAVCNTKNLQAAYMVDVDKDGFITTKVFDGNTGYNTEHPLESLKSETPTYTVDKSVTTGDFIKKMKDAYTKIDAIPFEGKFATDMIWYFEFKIDGKTFTYTFGSVDEYKKFDDFINLLMPAVPVAGPLWIYTMWLEDGPGSLRGYDHDIYRPITY